MSYTMMDSSSLATIAGIFLVMGFILAHLVNTISKRAKAWLDSSAD